MRKEDEEREEGEEGEEGAGISAELQARRNAAGYTRLDWRSR
jgi:hypothetical protein